MVLSERSTSHMQDQLAAKSVHSTEGQWKDSCTSKGDAVDIGLRNQGDIIASEHKDWVNGGIVST